jgi:hypothetical protein
LKLRIFHILNTDSYSGAENVAISILNNLLKDYTGISSSLDGSILNNVKIIKGII